MTKFTSSFDDLVADFQEKDIPTDSPGFCDHESFLRCEAQDPSFLNNYAAFVAKRPYSDDYLSRARRVIANATSLLYERLAKNGRLGACIDTSAILSRILDTEGIWNCGIKGSLTIDFPAGSGEEKTYFWSVDVGDFKAAHAWLFAPPFTVVDAVLKRQPYTGKKADFLPEFLLVSDFKQVTSRVEDIISLDGRAVLKMQGVPKARMLETAASQMRDIQKIFPALAVQMDGTNIKYSPVAIHASETPFEEMTNMEFDGRTPYEMYLEDFKDKI